MRTLDPLPCATYWCYEASGCLLYIGQARDPELRIQQHRTFGSPWISRFDHMEVLWFDTRTDALLMERKATYRDSPAFPSVVDGPAARGSAISSLAADLRLYFALDHAEARREATRTLRVSGYFDGACEPSDRGRTEAERDLAAAERLHAAFAVLAT